MLQQPDPLNGFTVPPPTFFFTRPKIFLPQTPSPPQKKIKHSKKILTIKKKKEKEEEKN